MEKGDIVLVPFPFTDLKGQKKRPALVLIVKDLDITVCFISTQLHWEEKTDLILKPSKINGLKKESLIKISKIATIDRNLIIGKLGNIDFDSKRELDKRLIKLFKIENNPRGEKEQMI